VDTQYYDDIRVIPKVYSPCRATAQSIAFWRCIMAILKLEDGTTYTQVDDIARELAPLNVQLKRWSIGDNPDVQNLLAKDVLSDEEKAHVQGSA